jgi:CHASE3 domain sensor protein
VTESTADRKKAVRRTTIILVTVAVTFYLGFILMSVMRA